MDTGQFIVSWGPGSEYILKLYVPDYCFTGFQVFAYNYQLPITVSWDTTQFQSPSLAAPECVGIGWNTCGAGVTNGMLVNDDILQNAYGLPIPPFPWYGVITFLTSIELVEVPIWPWFTNFPLGFDLRCGDPNETPWSTRNLRREPELHVYPNPASDELHVQTQLHWYNAEVYTAHGTRALTTQATVERNVVPTFTLVPGMYLLALYYENGMAVGRSRFVKF